MNKLKKNNFLLFMYKELENKRMYACIKKVFNKIIIISPPSLQ